jgi:hypothetical protein
MRLVRSPLVSRLTALAALLVLPLAGCNGCKSSQKHDTDAPAASASAASSGEPQTRRGPPPEEDRFAAAIAANLPSVPDPVIEESAAPGAELDNAAFRDRALAFVRHVVEGAPRVTCDMPVTSNRPFRAVVAAFVKGTQVGRGEFKDAKLCVALKEAARRTVAAAGGKPEPLAAARIGIDLPDHDYAMIDLQGKSYELDHGLVTVRMLDKALLEQRIGEGKEYLLRTIDPERKGVHKFYYATEDGFEPELHTIYTASTALTMMKLSSYKEDKRLPDLIKSAAEFMLSMQSRDEKDPAGDGAFFYTLDLLHNQPEQKLVVGTTSKTIFTLLELHARTKDKKYLDAVVKAANWLMGMQKPDGSVRSQLTRQGNRWMPSRKESLLYTGQVLSALSRTYRFTKDKKYLDAAANTASYLAAKVKDKGCWLGDEYRQPNPVSSSWVVMSLLDFVRASGDTDMERLVFRCADELRGRQNGKREDAFRYGRWQRSLSSSGTGWLAEVMSELFLQCKDRGMQDCDRFKDTVVKAIRQILQYTITPENAFLVRNPDVAMGGVFWSIDERYVRTDAVCHAMNSYLNVIGSLDGGKLLELPERPLAERLAGGPSMTPAGEDGADDDDDDGDPDEQPRGRRQDPSQNMPGMPMGRPHRMRRPRGMGGPGGPGGPDGPGGPMPPGPPPGMMPGGMPQGQPPGPPPGGQP